MNRIFKYFSAVVALAIAVTAVFLPPLTFASERPVYSVTSIGFGDDWPVYSSAPSSGTVVSGTVYAAIRKLATTTTSTQVLTFKAELYRDDVKDDEEEIQQIVSATTDTATISLSMSLTLDGTPSRYIKVVLTVKDSISGATYTKTKYMYPSANPAAKFTTLSPSKVVVGKTAVVSGKVVLADGNPAAGKQVKIYDSEDTLVAQTDTAADGTFSVSVSFSKEGDYMVVCEAAAGYIHSRYNFRQSGASQATSGETISVGGKFTDAAGHGVSGLHVGIFNKDGSLVKDLGNTTTDGSFSGRWTVSVPGTYHYGIIGSGRHGKDYGSIVVNGVEFTLSTNVTEVYAGLPRSQTIYVTVKKGTEYVANTTLDVEVYNNSTKLLSSSRTTDDKGKFSISLPANLSLGTLKIHVVGSYSGVYGEGEKSLPVVTPKPISIELSGISNPVPVGETTVVVTAYSNLNPPLSISTVKVEVTGDVDVKDLPEDGVIPNGGSFKIVAYGYGKFTIKVTAKDSGNHEVTSTFSFVVDGYKVSISPASAEVDSQVDIVVNVKDKDDNPVNNAIVKLIASESGAFRYNDAVVSQLVLDGRTTNIVGGVYKFKDVKLLKVSDVTLKVLAADSSLRYLKENGFTIEPKMVLSVTATPSRFLAGSIQTVVFEVKDENGSPVSGYIYIYDSKDNLVGNYSFSDGRFQVNLTLDAGDYTVKVYTSDKKKAGKIVLKVLMADVVLKPEKITAGEKISLHFALKNPIDGSDVIADEVKLKPNDNVELVGLTPVSVVTSNTGTFTFTASVADTSTIAKVTMIAKKNGFTLVEKDIPVGYPLITVEPKAVYMGVPVDVKVTLKDAVGSPMAGKEIKVKQGETILATIVTDDNGQALYRFTPNVAVPITFEYGKYAKATVGITLDPNPPVILSVSPKSGTVVHKDKIEIEVVAEDKETYVDEVYIDFKPIFIPTGQKRVDVSYKIELDEGENRIPIVVKDIAGNVTSTTVVITYEKVVVPPQIVGFDPPNGSTVDKNDLTVMVTVKAGSSPVTMLVVNYHPIQVMIPTGTMSIPVELKDLKEGENAFSVYAIAQDGQVSQSVTYTLIYKPKGHTVELRIGSTMFKVDGKPMYMDVYPMIDARYGRTLVPLRFISESLGYQVAWDGDSGIVTVVGERNGEPITIKLYMGTPEQRKANKKEIRVNVGGSVTTIVVYDGLGKAEVNGTSVDLSGYGVPFIYNGRVFVPLRFIMEQFGAKVDWDPATLTITISTE